MRTGLGTCIIALLVLAARATAQSPFAYEAPRLSDGQPDLEGAWGATFITDVERPAGVTALELPDAEAEALGLKLFNSGGPVYDPDKDVFQYHNLAKVGGAWRTSLIVEPEDGKLPFTQQAETLVAASLDYEAHGFDHPEERPLYERCLIGIGQAPIRPIPYATPTQIVQGPDAILLWTEDVAQMRIVDMKGRIPPDTMRSLEGYAAGRWEGNTLIIETTHFRGDPARTTSDRPILVGHDSKVIERLTRLSENELHYEFTVQDPALYAKSWRAEFVLRRERIPTLEYACHEGNYSMVNMLKAGRLGRQSVRTKQKPN